MTALAPVNALLQGGALRAVDHALAQSMSRLRPDTPAAVLLAAALCSRALAHGHSRLPLSRAGDLLAEIASERGVPELPPLADWLSALRASPWVFDAASADGDSPAAADFETAVGEHAARTAGRVLVLEDAAVSLRRYWLHEVALATALHARLATGEIVPDASSRQRIAAAFPNEDDAAQARAADIALGSRLLLLTGGPGTGKTRTVARILGLRAEQARADGTPLRIALAAPTGKAAARLAEAVREHAPDLSLPTHTLHRLLGLGGDGRPPRFDASRPLPFEVVVVDEASMVDLPMMSRLVAAVAADALLVLVGDSDQLPSVEAGAVLGALSEAGSDAPSAGGLSAHHVLLDRSFRQTDALDLAPVNAAIRAGDGDGVIDRLGRTAGLRWLPGTDAGLAAFVREHAVAQYRRIQACADLAGALDQAKRFRVLTALRDGPAGSQAINALIAAELQGGAATGAFFPGRLLLIRENSYRHGLFNGDIGLCWPDADGVLRVWFDGDADRATPGPRAWHPAQLPAHESAFALTVHKAQGSEYDRVLLALPEPDARVITRELLYTGLSRGRESATVWANEPLLRLAVARKMARWTGLAARLRRAGDLRPVAHSSAFNV
jgi:exodeoxyribonuclease V alpha subunit